MLTDGLSDIVELKLEVFGFHNKPLNRILQKLAPLLSRGGADIGHDGPNPRIHDQQTLIHQCSNRLVGRVRVDPQFLAEDAHRRKFITRPEATRDDRLLHGVNHLFINRRTGLE